MEKTEQPSSSSVENHSASMENHLSVNENTPQGFEASGENSSEPEMRYCIPEVFVATWLPEDHILELTQILQGASADRVENCLLHYVVETIEPAGWKAVWRATPQAAKKLGMQKCSDFIVDVLNVSQEKLVADVKIFEAVSKDGVEDDDTLERVKNKEVIAPLMQLYPLTVQENDVVDIATTAEVVEQIRFFYNHVWHAWDMEEENCCYNHYLISARLKLYQDIETGKIPSAIGSELRSLVRKASDVQREIERIERSGEVDGDVDQSEVMSLIQLHKQLEKLKARFDLLQQPVLRELSNHYPPMERCWSVSSCKSKISKVKIVMDCLSIAELAHLSKLPELLKSLPQVQEDAACQSFPTLQLALDTAVRGDVIVVLPGHHTLQHIGLISTGGVLVGLGENIIIEGTKDAGDILIDVSGDLTVRNVILCPAGGQVGLVHHKGILELNDITIEGGLSGVVGLGKSCTVFQNVTVRECTDKGLDFREGATATLTNSHFIECGIGMQLEEDSKISVTNCTFKKNLSSGILIMWPEGSDISSFSNIPKEALLKSMLQEYEGNSVEENKEDISVQVETKIVALDDLSSSDGKDRSSDGSTGSLDSGLEFLEYSKTNE